MFDHGDSSNHPRAILDRAQSGSNASSSARPADRRAIWLWLTLGLGASMSQAAADYRTGLHAFDVADFAGARRAWEAGAEAGDPKSQFGLGVLYSEGRGMADDPGRAAYWFRRAARQGSRDAQYQLGVMRAMGRGDVAQDAVQAYVWFYLAAYNGDAVAKSRRDLVANMLFPQEMAEAERRIAAWLDGDRSWLNDATGPTRNVGPLDPEPAPASTHSREP